MKQLSVCFFLLCSAAFAGSVVQQIPDNAGNMFEVTVTAPHDVDTRIIEGFRSAAVDVDSDSGRKPVNISGYRIKIKPVSNLRCRSVVSFYRPVPVVLDPGDAAVITCDTCVSLDAAAFPVSGNVNLQIEGPHHSICSKSRRPKLRMDAVSCFFTECEVGPFDGRNVVIYNASSTVESTFTAVVNQQFVHR